MIIVSRLLVVGLLLDRSLHSAYGTRVSSSAAAAAAATAAASLPVPRHAARSAEGVRLARRLACTTGLQHDWPDPACRQHRAGRRGARALTGRGPAAQLRHQNLMGKKKSATPIGVGCFPSPIALAVPALLLFLLPPALPPSRPPALPPPPPLARCTGADLCARAGRPPTSRGSKRRARRRSPLVVAIV